MATFALYVQSDCFASPVLNAVLRFSQAAVRQGHQIDHIFFYQAASLAICAEPQLPADEPDLVKVLTEFAKVQQIPLLYCVTAAEKRGIATLSHPARVGFIPAGLAEFAMRLDTVDRLIQF